MIYAENLKVYCNHGISDILDMELTAREGEHGRLTLRGRIADGGSMPAGGEGVRVTAEESGSGKEETLFQGTVLESHVFVEDGVSQIILLAGSIDEGMDRRRRSRSFQDTSQTYAQIIRDILLEYDGELQCEMPSVKIGRPMVQYEETDWEFCRRMAGSMGAGLFSHGENPCPCLSVGLVEGRKADFPSGAYRCGVDECYYQRGKGQGIPRADFLYYEVSTDRHYRIGDYTWYGGRKLHIYEARAVLEREELVFTYKLGSASRFCGTSRPNRKLAGLSVPGCVEKTEGESVYMKLDMDGEDGKALHPFRWAPATGNTAYCMPKTGTRAYLYFPDCYDQEPIAVGSIRTNGYSSCFGSIQDRGLETEHGKKLRLQADALRLEGGRPDGLQQAVLGEDMLCLQAGYGGLTLRAGNGISVQAPRVMVRTPLAINQNRLGEKGTGRKNPATGGRAYVTSQYEFSITSPLGELIGLEYEEYNPFEGEISYESYEAVEKRRRKGLFAGIAAALAIGALVALVAFTGGAALGVALAAGAVVAGVGSAVAAATYIRDTENSTASSMGTYIRNSGTASLITAMVIGSFWAAPYAADALALDVSKGLPLTSLFGHSFTLGELADWALIGTDAFAVMNAFFQTNELLAFFGETKELGAPTGCEVYDGTKLLTESYNMQFFGMGLKQWITMKPAYDFIKENVPPDFQQDVKEAFMMDMRVTTLKQDTTVYRYHGGSSNRISYWYTPNQTSDPARDLALPPGNTYQYMDTYVIPAGTTILEGTVAPNFGQPGGGYQFYVPNPSVIIKQ